jgi:hypothetical protein
VIITQISVCFHYNEIAGWILRSFKEDFFLPSSDRTFLSPFAVGLHRVNSFRVFFFFLNNDFSP